MKNKKRKQIKGQFFKLVVFMIALTLSIPFVNTNELAQESSENKKDNTQTISILNPHSKPKLNNNWTINFTTTGTADLIIMPFNGTKWSNVNEKHELKFLEIRCGDEIIDYTWLDNSLEHILGSVFVKNYNCDETSYAIIKVLQYGNHSLMLKFGSSTAHAYNALPSSIRGYWKLDETSGSRADSSGKGNTLSDINTVGYGSGIYGNAADFEENNNEYLKRDDDADFDITGDMSIVAWVNYESFATSSGGKTRNDIVAKFVSASSQCSYWTSIEGEPDGWSSSQIWNGEIYFWLATSTECYPQSGRCTAVLPYSINAGTWYHLGFTYDNAGTMKIFLDGTKRGTCTGKQTSIHNSAAMLTLAVRGTSDDTRTDGRIDDVAIFAATLGETTISNIKNYGLKRPDGSSCAEELNCANNCDSDDSHCFTCSNQKDNQDNQCEYDSGCGASSQCDELSASGYWCNANHVVEGCCAGTYGCTYATTTCTNYGKCESTNSYDSDCTADASADGLSPSTCDGTSGYVTNSCGYELPDDSSNACTCNSASNEWFSNQNKCCGDDTGEDFEDSGSNNNCCYNDALLSHGTAVGSILCSNGLLYDCNGVATDDSDLAEHKSTDDEVDGNYCQSDNSWSVLYPDGSSCTVDSDCSSGHCSFDYDGTGKWCCSSTQCAHDGVCENSGSCSDTYVCSTGSWVNHCNNGIQDCGEADVDCGGTDCEDCITELFSFNFTSPIKPPQRADVFVKEWKTYLIDKEGNKTKVTINIRVWRGVVKIPSCADQGGNPCEPDQICDGQFVSSTDYGKLCCIGTCQAPPEPSYDCVDNGYQCCVACEPGTEQSKYHYSCGGKLCCSECSCIDEDEDGYGVCPKCGTAKDCMYDGDDCDDNPADCGANCNPGITEDSIIKCSDGYDNDCDGLTDAADPDC